MKKFVVLGILLCFPLLFSGCQNSTESLVKANMSEITQNYYSLENQNFSLSISVGKRENPYLIDGIHHDTVDFSLLVFKDKTFSIKENKILCKIAVDGEESEVELEYNPISNAFMADLGFAINKNEKVEFIYNGSRLECPLVSDNFEISSQEALEMSIDKFQELLNKNISSGTLNGECYLKILGLKCDDDNLFWCFTFVGRDYKSYNLIISIKDGSILASDF